jgi:Tfp pilus assembly protein PilO
MTNVSYTILRKQQKSQIRVYAVLLLIVALGVGFYIFNQWRTYSSYLDIVAANKEYISALGTEVADEKALYDLNKDEFNGLSAEINTKLAMIFPENDNYTDLTRQIDQIEQDLSKRDSPFEISSLDFQAPVQNELYSVLPVRMSIRSSSNNFTKFLHLVENSGSLNDQVRLMDISSIRLNFQSRDEEAVGPEIITFTVQINAYFQK